VHQNEALLHRFFEALTQHDIDKIVACYDQQIIFSDPIFPILRGQDVVDMWRMLFLRNNDLQIIVNKITADNKGGHAAWQAQYTDTQTRRIVIYSVNTMFAFRDGLIIRQIDRFSFWQWSRQAFGLTGQLFGWSWPMKSLIRKKAMIALLGYQQPRPD
jgi:ketosteroid isomerase-like protein